MSNIISQLAESSPENVIKAPQGSFFYRTDEEFFLGINNNVALLRIPKKSFAVQYKNELWFPTLRDEIITFATDGETWFKAKGGNSKTGWVKYLSNCYNINLYTIIKQSRRIYWQAGFNK